MSVTQHSAPCTNLKREPLVLLSWQRHKDNVSRSTDNCAAVWMGGKNRTFCDTLVLTWPNQDNSLVITVSLSSLLIYPLSLLPLNSLHSLCMNIQKLFIAQWDNLSSYRPFCWTFSAAINGLRTLGQKKKVGLDKQTLKYTKKTGKKAVKTERMSPQD